LHHADIHFDTLLHKFRHNAGEGSKEGGEVGLCRDGDGEVDIIDWVGTGCEQASEKGGDTGEGRRFEPVAVLHVSYKPHHIFS
jgi:hypothetical protein